MGDVTETPTERHERFLAYVRSQAGKPYVTGAVGPAGYDCSVFLKPTDWTEWVQRDRVGVIRALVRIELGYRRRLLRDRAGRALVAALARRPHRDEARRRFTS